MQIIVPDYDLRGFIENSLLEWENRLSAVLISGGCNLRCPFCHSWRYVTQLELLPPQDQGRVFALLERQRGWIDGVVFTGGEPTLQPGLGDMMRRVREYDVKVKLHTNGTRPEVIAELLSDKLIDCLALDYKAPFTEKDYAAAAGTEERGVLARVKESFRLAAADNAVEKEYHTTLVPGIISRDGFKKMAAELAPGGVWFLQQYNPRDILNPAAVGAGVYHQQQLAELVQEAENGHRTVLTGVE